MNYKCLIFDCDGVILNSNKLKTQAFYQAALPYGEELAQALVDYHVQNGGISRYRKFQYFLENIVGKDNNSQALNHLLSHYAQSVKEGLLTCAIAPGLRKLRETFPKTRWLVVSGSDQTELRDIFMKREISYLFDGGIFGSPDSKEKILDRELENGNIHKPAVFLGDSYYDYQATIQAGLDFIFISSWSEWKPDSNINISYQVQSLNELSM